jgi:Fungal Zn(2)-Cys(6) binuclear cluster domain.
METAELPRICRALIGQLHPWHFAPISPPRTPTAEQTLPQWYPGAEMHRIEKERVRYSRSRPVSCHFCRSRKLKCNRQFPCSNCTSRGKTCQLYPTTALPTSPQLPIDGLPDNHTDVLARLRRLEEIVITNGAAYSPLGQDITQASSLPSPPNPVPNQPYMIQEGHSSAAAATWLEGEVTSSGSLVCLSWWDRIMGNRPLTKPKIYRVTFWSMRLNSEFAPFVMLWDLNQWHIEPSPRKDVSGYHFTMKRE